MEETERCRMVICRHIRVEESIYRERWIVRTKRDRKMQKGLYVDTKCKSRRKDIEKVDENKRQRDVERSICIDTKCKSRRMDIEKVDENERCS